MDLSKVVYLGVFLTEDSKEKLLGLFPERLPVVHAHHLTIAYKPDRQKVLDFNFGQRVRLRVVGKAADDKCQAALVSGDFESENAKPHVTVSTAEHVPPKYSNELLESAAVAPFEPAIEIEGVFGAYTNDGVITEWVPVPTAAVTINSKPQVDTVAAIFLLRKFGERHFPGISSARIGRAGLTPGAGEVALDWGGGIFDHHSAPSPTTASAMVCSYLGLKSPAFKKLLDFVYRDDVEGKGIISADPIDRAFGFPGMLAAASRAYPDDFERVVHMFLPILEAHYIEEEKRTEGLPREFLRLKEIGDVEQFSLRAQGRELKVISLTCDDAGMAGYLRSNGGGRYDIVAVWRTTGHLAIATRDLPGRPRLDISGLAATVRKAEAMLLGLAVPADADLVLPGKIDPVQMWHYDPGTNSVLNGGINYQSTPATKIPRKKLRGLIELAFRAR